MEYNPDWYHTVTVQVVTSILGNILEDESYRSVDTEGFERLMVSRHEMGRGRLRRNTDRGTDVGLSLEAGRSLHHGDIFEAGGRSILIQQMPEKVISITARDVQAGTAVLIGHRIGNMHRPVAVSGDTISFPIQADSELETFQKIFADMADHITMSQEEIVFIPHAGADVHGHE